jgi:hypothetical protein
LGERVTSRHIPFIIVAIEQKTPRTSSKNTIVIERLQNALTFTAMMTEERAVPTNTIEPEIALPLQLGFDPNALLAEQLERCHRAAMKCFDLCEDGPIYIDARQAFLTLAAKMMKTSMELTAALQKRRGVTETRRHVLIEHVKNPTPPHKSKNRKTNSGAGETESVHG